MLRPLMQRRRRLHPTSLSFETVSNTESRTPITNIHDRTDSFGGEEESNNIVTSSNAQMITNVETAPSHDRLTLPLSYWGEQQTVL